LNPVYSNNNTRKGASPFKKPTIQTKGVQKKKKKKNKTRRGYTQKNSAEGIKT